MSLSISPVETRIQVFSALAEGAPLPGRIQDLIMQYLEAGPPWMSNNKALGLSDLTDLELQDLPNHAAHLQAMHLMRCDRVTSQGLRSLAELSNLHTLHLFEWQGKVGEKSQQFPLLHRLTTLDICNCVALRDVGVQALMTSFPNLETLRLRGCPGITSEGLRSVATLRHLKELALFECHQVTNEGMAHIPRLCNLKQLDLCRCSGLTDDGLRLLVAVKSLFALRIIDCRQITQEGLKVLKTAGKMISTLYASL